MTMDELGAALGFEGKNMSVRVSQYETGARVPSEDMLLKIAKATYNEADYSVSGTVVGISFEYGLVNDFLLEWNTKKQELTNGDITPNEYFEWKINWPHA